MKYLEEQEFKLTNTSENNRETQAKILILYGSLRQGSKSKLLAEEAGRILEYFGAEVKFYDPTGLPQYDGDISVKHSKVQELRDLSQWSDGQVWSSPEYHGNMSV